jgi:NADH-ubiquinone oxidoreductase chain 3
MNITLLVLMIFVPILALILLGLNTLLAPHRAYESKLSQYESGMPVVPGQTRESFQVHFWLVAMLFLVFDIELVLLLPVSVSLSSISTFGFAIAVIFFIVLTIGFILELSTNSISLTKSPESNKTN